jgi:hypothetical protein
MPGESVSPVIRANSWVSGGTWGTTSNSSTRSQFSVVWLCELVGKMGPDEMNDSEISVVNEIRYRKSMTRISVLIGTCFTLLIVLAASFIQSRISQDQYDQVQQSQARQGQAVEEKLCTTLEGLRSLTPPAGNPSSNPSRAYLQEQHNRLAELSTDIGCKG